MLQNVVYSADTKSVEFVAKAFFNQQTQEWDLVEGAGGVTYNGGTTVAPVDADRPAHDKSFYDDATVAVSYLFCACNFCLALFCGIWTIAFRARKIVKHSQPEFLVMICAGCMLSSATILGLAQSNDKGAAEDVGGKQGRRGIGLDARSDGGAVLALKHDDSAGLEGFFDLDQHRGVLECLIAGALLTASPCGVAK